MNTVDVKTMSDAQLIERVEYLVKRERQLVECLIWHLQEIQDRKLYILMGYTSLLKTQRTATLSGILDTFPEESRNSFSNEHKNAASSFIRTVIDAAPLFSHNLTTSKLSVGVDYPT